MHSVTVRHNFETAHRLPHLGGRCTNLHGHSWWAEVTVTGQPDDRGVVLDFGPLKAAVREWIDTYLDHGAMLGRQDPLVEALEAEGCKLLVFGEAAGTAGLAWPTVENVAELVRRATDEVLRTQFGGRWLVCTRVRVSETHVNAAEVVR